MTNRRAKAVRGFTLIELMVTAAILGVLASVAIPEFELFMIRSKVAERPLVMKRIKQGVDDLYRMERLLPGTDIVGTYQPAGTPGNMKRPPDFTQPGWTQVFSSFADIEGTLYYSYSFQHHEGNAGEPSTLLVVAVGDLDGDGLQSVRWDFYQRDSQGLYQQVGRYPATPDLDDSAGF
ncbi:MAG TPA: prepilin-type N-terminal cleavage/methylation domain-containing protein [Anaeromyxobacteraceae bacterium]|nr:prepilin-type N-terminal cleavage/methylation domain-containing protein [Anaeromyxobacteraceae bacterium]